MINYFNYFTEIEEHFQRARGSSLFLLSPLDWALVESWKNSGVPLEAVLRGIDGAFEKWRARRVKTQQVNSLAFCAQAVLLAAQRMPDSIPAAAPADPFPPDAVQQYLLSNAAILLSHPSGQFAGIAASLHSLAASVQDDLEALEQSLTVLEEKLVALVRSAQPDSIALEIRRDLDLQLRPYRGKMTAPQLAMLERQYVERRTLEAAGLPRLSLFYLR
ncbi:MAG: hypothetical protein M3Z09_15135 [Acidobacteriota bacterium]|nr:hypothetical protein [Acidobacteriota bacterium]